MWKRVPELKKKERRNYRNLRKAKIYADANINDELIEFLRQNGINIISAKECGHLTKPDTFHVSFAYKKKRFLLTKDIDFMDDKRFPFNGIYGILFIDNKLINLKEYFAILLMIKNFIIPFGEIYVGRKIKISTQEIRFKFINHEGRCISQRFKIDRHEIYEWEW